ncbi:MAG: carotenoid biosynthesis protein [Bacteroidota bacterium]|nr:carotenoid biosynthesis protein [Bacteroidota bacterium]
MKQSFKNAIALSIALLFHISGFIGIVFTPYKEWFIQHTPLNLLLMFLLLLFTQKKYNKPFFVFAVACFITGLIAEMIGVNTGWLFGNYAYGEVMGIQWLGVPLLIGINWFVVVFCSGSIMFQLQTFIENKYAASGLQLSPAVKRASLVIDSALLATFFDFIMEPVAMRLGFWQWKNAFVPLYNYVCWFAISALLLWLFGRLSFDKKNYFSIHLLIIQLLFFLALRIYL